VAPSSNPAPLVDSSRLDPYFEKLMLGESPNLLKVIRWNVVGDRLLALLC
jgi:hypothetical protein